VSEKNLYGFHIRLATEDEIDAIQNITKISFQKYIRNAGLQDIEALNETTDQIKEDIKNKLVFVAFINDDPVGSVRIEIKNDNTAYLSRFGVINVHQNQGVGKSMMSVIDSVMLEKGVKRLELHTASKYFDLVRFYYGRSFYIESVSTEKGYLRALLVKEYE
jgi:predicted N-acetyltransferase YhbS